LLCELEEPPEPAEYEEVEEVDALDCALSTDDCSVLPSLNPTHERNFSQPFPCHLTVIVNLIDEIWAFGGATFANPT
jgi:hypothetical protein